MGGELFGGAGAVLSPFATSHLLDSKDVPGGYRLQADVAWTRCTHRGTRPPSRRSNLARKRRPRPSEQTFDARRRPLVESWGSGRASPACPVHASGVTTLGLGPGSCNGTSDALRAAWSLPRPRPTITPSVAPSVLLERHHVRQPRAPSRLVTVALPQGLTVLRSAPRLPSLD